MKFQTMNKPPALDNSNRLAESLLVDGNIRVTDYQKFDSSNFESIIVHKQTDEIDMNPHVSKDLGMSVGSSSVKHNIFARYKERQVS